MICTFLAPETGAFAISCLLRTAAAVSLAMPFAARRRWDDSLSAPPVEAPPAEVLAHQLEVEAMVTIPTLPGKCKMPACEGFAANGMFCDRCVVDIEAEEAEYHAWRANHVFSRQPRVEGSLDRRQQRLRRPATDLLFLLAVAFLVLLTLCRFH